MCLHIVVPPDYRCCLTHTVALLYGCVVGSNRDSDHLIPCNANECDGTDCMWHHLALAVLSTVLHPFRCVFLQTQDICDFVHVPAQARASPQTTVEPETTHTHGHRMLWLDDVGHMAKVFFYVLHDIVCTGSTPPRDGWTPEH